MMRQETRGIFTLFLVTSIAMFILSAFGFYAIRTQEEAQLAPAQCKYSNLIITAKEYPADPVVFHVMAQSKVP